MGSFATIRNVITGKESPIKLTLWDKIKERPEYRRAFIEVERIIEPPEVAELNKRKAAKK